MDKSELEAILLQHDISFQKWGTGKAKTVDDLLEEINSGEAEVKSREGKLLRTTKVVSITVTYWDGNNDLILVEDRQVFSDGRERKRVLDASLGEKMFVNEVPEEAARRALKEELCIIDVEVVSIGTKFRGPEMSLSYPGLETLYELVQFSAKLPTSLFRPEGYMEDDGKKKTYFVWQPRG